MTHRELELPDTGVVRIAVDPGRLPRSTGAPGPNRFDDPRPNTLSPFIVRYTATTARGCFLELLGWLRPDADARTAEAAVVDDDTASVSAPNDDDNLRQAITDYLAERRVGRFLGQRLRFVSIDDPGLQAELDREPAVRALLDSPDGRAALSGDGSARRPRLDGAAVRLASVFGRDLTRHCSLAIHDRVPAPAGVHYRSRFDDDEDCWAIFGHVPLTLVEDAALSATTPVHRNALRSVAALWGLPLPREWE